MLLHTVPKRVQKGNIFAGAGLCKITPLSHVVSPNAEANRRVLAPQRRFMVEGAGQSAADVC